VIRNQLYNGFKFLLAIGIRKATKYSQPHHITRRPVLTYMHRVKLFAHSLLMRCLLPMTFIKLTSRSACLPYKFVSGPHQGMAVLA